MQALPIVTTLHLLLLPPLLPLPHPLPPPPHPLVSALPSPSIPHEDKGIATNLSPQTSHSPPLHLLLILPPPPPRHPRHPLPPLPQL